jgi:hypothetical protein
VRALLVRLEAGVTAPRDRQRVNWKAWNDAGTSAQVISGSQSEVVRLLYFATRHQVQALVAVFQPHV